jgi:hypothetical protein
VIERSRVRYDDFAVQLEALAGGGCRARVIASPAGEAAGEFALPLTRAELDALAAAVAGDVRRRRGAPGQPLTLGPVAPPALHDVGLRLFRALFSDRVRWRYDESRGRVSRRADVGLRLKLHLALDDPGAVELHALPWEFLLRPDDAAYLALGRDTALVRYLNLPVGADRPPLPLPLRVLAVPSSPEGVTPLEVERELDALVAGLGRLAGVEVEALRPPTLDGLRRALVEREFHVLHFMGHGGLDAEGAGVLCFADDRGAPRGVSGRDLAQQVRDVSSLRLVVLNACDSARAAVAAPFAGAATALLLAGVPAVVAMQFAITDTAALAFSQMFYARVAAGDAVDTAVAEARLAVSRAVPGTLEWGTPVLFMRSPDGRLFENAPSTSPTATRRLGARPAWAAAALLAAAAVGVGLSGRVARSPNEGATAPSPHASARAPGPASAMSPAVLLGSPTPAPRPVVLAAATPRPPATPSESPIARRPTPRTLQLADSESAELPELGATVAVAFIALYGQDTLRVTLSAPGVSGPPPAPILGPDTLEFRGTRGVYHVDVVVIAWQARRATVRVRLE